MRRYDSHHGGFTCRVANSLAHARYQTIKGDTVVGSGIQWCREICCGVLCYADECRDTWLYAVVYDERGLQRDLVTGTLGILLGLAYLGSMRAWISISWSYP